MSLHHLFCKNTSIAEEADSRFVVELDPQDCAHVRALRLKKGEHIALVDASQDYFEVEVLSVQGDRIEARVSQHLDAVEPDKPLNLVQGLAKGEKMDTVLRAATELGIAAFYPTEMERCVVHLDEKKKKKRSERFNAIARSASLQSGRQTIPVISQVNPLKAIVANWNARDVVLIFWEEAPSNHTLNWLFSTVIDADLLGSAERFWAIVGPEGGLSADEVDLMQGSDASVFILTLGPTILRTETAGIVATALTMNSIREAYGREER